MENSYDEPHLNSDDFYNQDNFIKSPDKFISSDLSISNNNEFILKNPSKKSSETVKCSLCSKILLKTSYKKHFNRLHLNIKSECKFCHLFYKNLTEHLEFHYKYNNFDILIRNNDNLILKTDKPKFIISHNDINLKLMIILIMEQRIYHFYRKKQKSIQMI